jgi:hypothetical protein
VNVRLPAFATALALTVGILAGCASTPPDITDDASVQLQATVVSVAEIAAAGDAAGALAQLDVLQQQLDAAVAAGSVTSERAAAIQSRIDIVRTDLQPAPQPTVEPAPEPTAEPAPQPAPDDKGEDKGEDKGKDKGDDDGGDDNSGPGNNNGNNNGGGND